MTSLTVLGLNCGTSVDAVDAAVCKISLLSDSEADSSAKITVDLLSYSEVPVPLPLKKRVLQCCNLQSNTSTAEVCDLNFALGELFGQAALQCDTDLGDIDLIASHGQTVWHEPRGKSRNSTLQLADPACIAQATGKTVVSGFRAAEVAAGRQGAPICGFFESCILRDKSKTRVSQNIGGIGNVTVVPKGGGKFFQFDTGPGNVLIDAAVRELTNGTEEYDKDGIYGKAGREGIDHGFVREFLARPYFGLSPPKTTGREIFGENEGVEITNELKARGLSKEAIIATVTRITSESIARAYEEYVIPQCGSGDKIDEIYLCGGGAYNPNIVEHLSSRFPQSIVDRIDNISPISASAKEGAAFAVLGFLAIHGIRTEVPRFSEAETPKVMGSLTPGENYLELLGRVEFPKRALTLNSISVSSS